MITINSIKIEVNTILERESHNYYGLRVMTANPLTGEKQEAEVGGFIEDSFDWEDDMPTDIKLHGVCAIQIHVGNIDEAIDRIKTYWMEGEQLVLIGSQAADAGNDPFEIIMYENDKVLAVWDVN
jgi:hypothetical protein